MNLRKLALTGVAVLLGLTVLSTWVVAGPPAITRPAAAVLTVCPAGPPDCQYATIQAAVDAANSGDVVKIAAGVYTGVAARPVPGGYAFPPDSGQIVQVVYVDKTLTLQGGYAAPGFAGPPDPEENATVIDAQQQGRALVAWGEISPTIQGLQLVNGNAMGQGGYVIPGEPYFHVGGNAFVQSAALTLTHSHLSGGTADSGAGLYVAGCDPAMIQDNILADNTGSRGWGGGLFAVNSTIGLSRNTLTNNYAEHGGGGFLKDCQYTLAHNAISGNSVGSTGGGFRLRGGGGTVERNDISSNRAEDNGGGLSLYDSRTLIANNIISANVAESEGGGLHSSNEGSLVLTGNRFVNNRALRHSGSAAFLALGTLELENNWIINDQGADSCSLFLGWADVTMRHTTIVGPRDGTGIGVYVNIAPLDPKDVSLTNTVLVGWKEGIYLVSASIVAMEGTFWGAGPWANDADWFTPWSTNIITTGTVNVWSDPGFVDPAGGDYHLGPHSAAIDAGVDAGVATDQDGEARPRGCAPDIGADEFPGLPPLELTRTSVVEGNGTLTLTVTWTHPAHVDSYTLVTSPTPIDEETWASATVLTGSLPASNTQVVATVPFDGRSIYLAARYTACGDISVISNNVSWPIRYTYLPLVSRASP